MLELVPTAGIDVEESAMLYPTLFCWRAEALVFTSGFVSSLIIITCCHRAGPFFCNSLLFCELHFGQLLCSFNVDYLVRRFCSGPLLCSFCTSQFYCNFCAGPLCCNCVADCFWEITCIIQALLITNSQVA
eukprot:NODE_651_length_5520_cov_0.396975.p3 type:complete len:131 gc:universal NODE_651_length_5520_cov_0.396975:1729-1337(-)